MKSDNKILGNHYKGFDTKAQRPNIYLYTKSYKIKKNVINRMPTKDNIVQLLQQHIVKRFLLVWPKKHGIPLKYKLKIT